MSVLDAFYLLFQTDAKEAAKDVKGLNKELSSTETIGKKLENSIGGSLKSLLGAATALVSVGAITLGITNAANYADELGKLSQKINVSVEDIDAWSSAIERNGGSADSFRGTLSSLSERFAMMGRSGQSATNYLLRVSSILQKMNVQRGLNFGKQIGLDESTILLLRKGRGAVEELIAKQKEMSEITKKDTEIARKFKEQWHDTSRTLSSIFTGANSSILPFFTKLLENLESFAGFFRRHRPLITGSIIAIAGAITYFLTPAILRLVAASLPFTAIAIAVVALGAAFAIAYDDIKTFIAGGDSLYGRLISQYPMIHEVVKNTGTAISKFWNGLLITLDVVAESIKAIVDRLIWSFNIVNDTVLAILESIFGWLGKITESTKDMIKGVSDAAGAVGDFFSGKDSKTQVTMRSIEQGKVVLDNASSNPLNSIGSNALSSSFMNRASNNNTSVSTGDITINTQATDAKGIAESFDTHLKNQLIEASNNYADGIHA